MGVIAKESLGPILGALQEAAQEVHCMGHPVEVSRRAWWCAPSRSSSQSVSLRLGSVPGCKLT